MSESRRASSTRKAPKPEPAKAGEPVTLTHCAPGDPCQRTLLVRPDGTVWFSALCAEMLPVAQALTPDLPKLKNDLLP